MSHQLLKSESWLALLALLVVISLPAAAWAQASASFPAPVLLPENPSDDQPGTAGMPYDLTPFEADMVLAFDDNGIARPEWPRPPVITSTCNVAAGSASSLNACASVDGAHIIIPAGEYAGPFTFDGDDQWFEMADGTNLYGGVNFGNFSVKHYRIKVTGGNFIEGDSNIIGIDDFLMDNVNMELKSPGGTPNRYSFQNCAIGTTCLRTAIINSTCHATTACLLNDHSVFGSVTSLIVANLDAWSQHTPEGTGNDEYVSRLQNTDRVMIVDSHFRVYPTGKPSQRYHWGTTATLLVNNIFETSGTGFTNVWIDTVGGSSPETEDIDNMFILRNNFYQHDSTKTADINIDDSVPGNGIDVVLVHVEDNVSHHINEASFTIGGVWNSAGQDCGGRGPCLRNINNRGVIVPGLTLVPFTGGADHSSQSSSATSDPPPSTPAAPSPPPQTGGACSVQPNLNPGNILGGPFLDCGYSDSTRVPEPTRMQHALQSMTQQTTCITPDFTPASWAFPNLPEIEISNSDQEYHNSGTFPGDVVFTGQRVKFINTQGGRVLGNPVCGAGARYIEYDGVCICP